MNCPECLKTEIGDYLAQTDQLWCEFEAEVIEHELRTIYYCRHCDWHEERKFDPQLLHDFAQAEEE